MSTIVVAGATGRLGERIVKALLERGARVIALSRPGSKPEKVEELRRLGAEPVSLELTDVAKVSAACRGAACVVSAVLGMRDVLVDGQDGLLQGAVKAGVPKFIPSDYSLDFNQLEPGENRNLELHREFQERLDRAPIAATSILNGAFMELLVGPAPFIVFKWNKVLYWANANQRLEFTAMNDVAAYTAEAALDPNTPRFLKIAGEKITSRQLAEVVSEVTGRKFTTQWAGTLGTLNATIKVMRAFMPAENDPFPPWQGMQYSHNMFSGRGALGALDNARYPRLKWTSVRQLLTDSGKR